MPRDDTADFRERRVIELAATCTVQQIMARMGMTERVVRAILKRAGVRAKGMRPISDPAKLARDRRRRQKHKS